MSCGQVSGAQFAGVFYLHGHAFSKYGATMRLPLLLASLLDLVGYIGVIVAQKQMIWVYATSIVACVENMRATRYFSKMKFIRGAVCVLFFTCKTRLPISFWKLISDPLPTTSNGIYPNFLLKLRGNFPVLCQFKYLQKHQHILTQNGK